MLKHTLKCWLWKLMWLTSVVALGTAFYEVLTQAPVLGLAPDLYLWTALIVGVLAIPVKLDCQNCGACKVSTTI